MDSIEVIQFFQSIWTTGFGIAKSFVGALRGIAMIQDRTKFTLNFHLEGSYWIMVDLTVNNSKDTCHVCNVYGPICYNHKVDFWNSLNSFGDFQNYVIARDFNATISSKERRGDSWVRDPFEEHFEDLITNIDLVDIK